MTAGSIETASDISLTHDALRPLMFSIAYRMLGSVAEAEDVVEEGWLRIQQAVARGTKIESGEAFATTVTTRIAIDELKSARRRRETYVGAWLPEPLVDEDAGPAQRIEADETLSTAFLLVLERLTPTERAVFLLREVFDYEYEDIAEVVDKSVGTCRQLLVRARKHIEEARPRFDPTPAKRAELAERFFEALRTGDVTDLERLLAADVVFMGDGGGKVQVLPRPLEGVVAVIRFLRTIQRQAEQQGFTLVPAVVNGRPGAKLRAPDGSLYGVLALGIEGDRIVALYNQINPDKLAHLA